MAINAKTSWEIYNENAVKRLQEEDPDILPSYAVNSEEDLAYNKKQINSVITSAIIQGKSIDNIAADLQSRMSSMNRSSAIRTARTAITNAQNGGKLKSMYELQAMGVDVRKEWVATLDDRTRESHRNLDGQRRELDEPFSNGLQYPGASGPAAEVYNCRCTMVTYIPDVDTSDAVRWSRNILTGEREYTSNKTMVKWGADILRPLYNQVSKIKTKIGLILDRMSDHSLWQAYNRQVSQEEIVDALENPLEVAEPEQREDGQRSQRFIGYFATVNVNPDTGVLSTLWKTGSRIRKKFERE